MLNTFLVCSGFSPTSAALRPAHAPFATATPRSIPATMLAKRRASGGGKAEVAYTVLEEDGSDVWRADDAVAVIRSGGVGVIPTDTGYDDARVQSHVSCGPPAGRAAARLRTALSLATLPRPRRYSFITAVSSKQGVSRILKLKGVSNGRKPLSLLCRDLATIQEYALGIDKTKYKTLRPCHP